MIQNLIDSGREAHRTGAWDESLAHFESALQLLDQEKQPATRCDVLRAVALVYRDRGDLDKAETTYEQSGQEAEAAELKDKVAAACIAKATVELLRGNLELASNLFLQAREVCEGLGEDRMVAMVDQNLGVIANIQGNVGLALLSYRS